MYALEHRQWRGALVAAACRSSAAASTGGYVLGVTSTRAISWRRHGDIMAWHHIKAAAKNHHGAFCIVPEHQYQQRLKRHGVP